MFSSKIHDAVKEIKPSKRNQLEITDAVQWLIDRGFTVQSSMVNHWWKDTGKPEDILHANRLILDDIHQKNHGKVLDSEIRGRVEINKNTIIEKNSMIKGPVAIGKNCKISNSYIGPFTSIGDNCEITSTEIEDSVIMEGTIIKNGGRIADSLIGKNAKIIKKKGPHTGSLYVFGDNSEVHL